MSDLEGFAELTHLLREVSARISRRGVEVAGEYELTPMAANALWYAGIGDTAPSMRELAHRVRTDPSRMTAVADELEARGLARAPNRPHQPARQAAGAHARRRSSCAEASWSASTKGRRSSGSRRPTEPNSPPCSGERSACPPRPSCRSSTSRSVPLRMRPGCTDEPAGSFTNRAGLRHLAGWPEPRMAPGWSPVCALPSAAIAISTKFGLTCAAASTLKELAFAPARIESVGSTLVHVGG